MERWSKIIVRKTNIIYLYFLVWFRRSEIPTRCQSPDSLYFLITYGLYKKRKYYYYYVFVVSPVWLLAFSLMLYRICTRAQENCGKPVPIQSAILQSMSPVPKKMTSCSAFRYAGRRPARSPIQVLTQSQAAWLGWHLRELGRLILTFWTFSLANSLLVVCR